MGRAAPRLRLREVPSRPRRHAAATLPAKVRSWPPLRRPLRAAPRRPSTALAGRYPPQNMEADIEAVLAGRPLPPPSPALAKAWEDAKREAVKSEYAFKPGYNYVAGRG